MQMHRKSILKKQTNLPENKPNLVTPSYVLAGNKQS